MSGISEEHDLLAAEYVLGTLDPQQAREVAARAKTDLALAQAITAWEERLVPLALSVPPVTPPASLWQRLSASIAPQQDSALICAWRSVALWRGATAAGFAPCGGAGGVPAGASAAESVAALVPAGSGVSGGTATGRHAAPSGAAPGSGASGQGPEAMGAAQWRWACCRPPAARWRRLTCRRTARN